MNCPAKTDPEPLPGRNQSPSDLAADLTTRSDFNRIANARLRQDHKLNKQAAAEIELKNPYGNAEPSSGAPGQPGRGETMWEETLGTNAVPSPPPPRHSPPWIAGPRRLLNILIKFSKFIGPGFIISVAYIDPGNYSTDVSAGASYRFKLLFIVLLSNIFAIFLQVLCIRLGSVTGMNLAQMCKAHFPPWLNYTLYVFAEVAIIATDMAEVIGTAIALNLLLHIPLVAGCAISIADVLFILLFYRPEGRSMTALRAFEFFVVLLVLGVAICFSIQLSLIRDTSVGEVFRGYVPSSTLVQGQALYQACGILGATVMPHSLYLGSGIVQARLKDFDRTNQSSPPPEELDNDDTSIADKYQPSFSAIRHCMMYSIAELSISLFTFAIFINSAILIVAGASLSSIGGASEATLFGIHKLLSQQLAPAAGTIFALALLLSGISAGIVCTMAGQMISEGQLSLTMKPWKRRLLTRSISITPSIIIAGSVGQQGLSTALNASQVALSIILPFVAAPLLYFTALNKFMTVQPERCRDRPEDRPAPGRKLSYRNSWFTTAVGILIWLLISIMDVASLVFLGLGDG